MLRLSEKRDNIVTFMEMAKEDIWALLDNCERTHQKCPYDENIRANINNILDYLDSMEFDSELNPDGN